MSTTEELSQIISQATFAAIPPEVVEVAKVVILDGLGVTLAGSQEPAARIVAEYVGEMGGTALCSVFGHGFQTSPVMAAFANGVLGHGLLREDMHAANIAHLGVVAWPVLLALAQRRPVSGHAFLAVAIARAGIRDGARAVRRGARTGALIAQETSLSTATASCVGGG